VNDPAATLNVLIGLFVLAAVVWGLCALSAFANYNAFKQRQDLAWVGTFALFALVRLGYAWESYGWREGMPMLSREMVNTLGDAVFFRLRFAAIEAVAVFLLFYLYRKRRSMF